MKQWVVGRSRAGRPSRSSFAWQGRQVGYFHHRYHYTWLNERAVETALALEVLREHAGRDILEIGNVLSHYLPVEHLVVDKYERKISFINAMAELCEAAGGDVTELADAIGMDARIGRQFLNAGLGFGGGCLPKDIRAFMARAGELGADEALTFLREVDAHQHETTGADGRPGARGVWGFDRRLSDRRPRRIVQAAQR